ncbi:hypothetical protein D1AOALGA4SA_7950 [Olavius algarvensis Delta 1 endosymbiont]|nr:hypothetical protein D1AOALGA4SA_7950 [Olavius algarvensis Delta 1 endosymbiont]
MKLHKKEGVRCQVSSVSKSLARRRPAAIGRVSVSFIKLIRLIRLINQSTQSTSQLNQLCGNRPYVSS